MAYLDMTKVDGKSNMKDTIKKNNKHNTFYLFLKKDVSTECLMALT
jgi:hypothetical protein